MNIDTKPIKYKTKKTQKLIKQLKPYWKELEDLEGEFQIKVFQLENKMNEELGRKDLEFFMCDGAYVGIGDIGRDMKLIHREELE